MRFKTIRDFALKDQVVLLRADLNVPAKDKQVTDMTRIDRLKQTIDYLAGEGAKIVVLSHFGRPKGRDEENSMRFLVPFIEKSWGRRVAFADDCVGGVAADAVAGLQQGEIVLLENLRFHKGEEGNDPDFVRALAALGDLYVNDAFSAAHRAHASTEGLAHILPASAGLLMEAELNALDAALGNPQRPVMAIVGGAKISTKLSVLNHLIQKVDKLCLGGGMANTFLYAQGKNIGDSLCEKDMADEARDIMNAARMAGCEIILPVDCAAVEKLEPGAAHKIAPSNDIAPGWQAVDIGPDSVALLQEKLDECKTILWNGPVGVFEIPPFDNGTNEAARAVAARTTSGQLCSVAGGGDTVAALEHAGVAGEFTYVSSAGGAFLEWMEGKDLPGVAALAHQ